MSNPDVAGIDASKRLAKAGCASGRLWRYNAVGVPYRTRGHNNDFHAGEVAAPTIGEMGEEIRRRGLRMIVTLERRGDGAQEFGVTIPGMAHAVHEREADARANALAEAIEKEQKWPSCVVWSVRFAGIVVVLRGSHGRWRRGR